LNRTLGTRPRAASQLGEERLGPYPFADVRKVAGGWFADIGGSTRLRRASRSDGEAALDPQHPAQQRLDKRFWANTDLSARRAWSDRREAPGPPEASRGASRSADPQQVRGLSGPDGGSENPPFALHRTGSHVEAMRNAQAVIDAKRRRL